ncbi:hypothetical protein BG006_010083 [Podila minutissima]|uniref:Uncharacterized protein n=1 Tax=Podila minutissima TaxID=64525 RepID=A0A9P5SDV0_9FUNG|nr:hypothetical protein BG006_010083 [Podila minutissima]
MQIFADTSNQVYNWELEAMPIYINLLQGPLHLVEFLHTGHDQLDIVQGPDTDHASGKVLRSLYPHMCPPAPSINILRSVPNLRSKDAFLGSTSHYIRLEYHMMFQPGFDWVKGSKLEGLFSGTKRGCNAGFSSVRSAETVFHDNDPVYFPTESKESCKHGLDKGLPDALFQLEKKHINEVRIPEKDETTSMSPNLKRMSMIEVQDLVLPKNGHDPNNLDYAKFMFPSFFYGHTPNYSTPVAQWIAWRDFKMSTSIKNTFGSDVCIPV